MVKLLCVAVLALCGHGQVSPNNVIQRVPHPHGWVMLVHGGAWVVAGKQYLTLDQAGWFREQGWNTYTIDYRVGIDSWWDTLAAYDYIQKRTKLPICVYGQSAGAHLALVLAAARRVACVIGEGPPTDLQSLSWQLAYDGSTIPHQVYLYAKQVFGNYLRRFSPVYLAPYIHAKILLARSSFDWLIPQQQMDEFKEADPKAEVMTFPGVGGTPNFTHAGITDAALGKYHLAVEKLLKSAII